MDNSWCVVEAGIFDTTNDLEAKLGTSLLQSTDSKDPLGISLISSDSSKLSENERMGVSLLGVSFDNHISDIECDEEQLENLDMFHSPSMHKDVTSTPNTGILSCMLFVSIQSIKGLSRYKLVAPNCSFTILTRILFKILLFN